MRRFNSEVAFPERTQDRQRDSQQMDDPIAKAAGVAGLRSLQLSLLAGHTSHVGMDVAHFLEDGNHQLQQRLKWEGAVMGLGGRVDVVLDRGMPGDYYAVTHSGLVYNREVAQRPQVIIQGQPNSYFHELGHALDIVMARQAYQFNARANTLTQSMEDLETSFWPDLKIRRDTTMEPILERVLDGLVSRAPDWQKALERQALDSGKDYWTRRQEALAFALAGQLGVLDPQEPWRAPSAKEADAQAPVFDRFFADLKPLNLGARAGETLQPRNEKAVSPGVGTRVRIEEMATSKTAEKTIRRTNAT